MFLANRRPHRAPCVAPIFHFLEGTTVLETIAEDNGFSDNSTKGTGTSMIVFLATRATIDPPTPIDQACMNMFTHESAGAMVNYIHSISPDTVNGGFDGLSDDDKEVINLVNGNIDEAPVWIQDLVNGAKGGVFKPENVLSYFASLGHTATKAPPIFKLVNSVAQFLPDMISQDAFRSTLSNLTWTVYRITRVSTGSIMSKLVPPFQSLGLFTDADIALIYAARDAPWNTDAANSIRDRLKGLCFLFLEAAGTPIPGWYQGSRAAGEIPSVTSRNAKLVFARYLSIRSDTTGLDAITTIAALAAGPAANLL
jgi:hypothetical protein